jgi:hypothetical protein
MALAFEFGVISFGSFPDKGQAERMGLVAVGSRTYRYDRKDAALAGKDDRQIALSRSLKV